jgi:sulfofructosephosphate aldolase
MTITLDSLARDSGTFLMVAMDQRESLRTMLAQQGHDATDERMVAFKVAVARELAPHASGFLIDRHYGFDEVAGAVAATDCGLILAVDALDQQPGEIVQDTELDGGADLEAAKEAGAVAIKLLVIWRDDDRRLHRVEMSRRFVELAAAHGLLSVLEPVVRGADGFDREAAIVAAAAELGAVGPSLYKCEVPLHGQGDAAEITARCREIDAAVPCPWVVLSQGVDPGPCGLSRRRRGCVQGRCLRHACRAGGVDGDAPGGRPVRAPAHAFRPAAPRAGRDRRHPRPAVAREG